MRNVAQYPVPQPDIHVRPPLVHMEPRWQYKYVTRDRFHEQALGEDELNTLGSQGWELVGLFSDACVLHYYFKRVGE